MLARSNPAAIAPDEKFDRHPQQELENYIASQANSVAPEPADPIAARMRLNNRFRVQEAIADGEIFWQKQQSFKRLKDYKDWLVTQGFTWKNVCKYIKLYQTFASFPLDQIGWVDLATLFGLCQPRYRQLLEELRRFSKWPDAHVQELMQQSREAMKKEKPRLVEPGTGWRQLPGGGRGYQLPMLHIDWLGVLIEKALNITNQTLSQLIQDVVVFFISQGQVPGLSVT